MNKLLVLLISIGVGLGGLAALALSKNSTQKVTELQAVEWLDKPRQLADFSLKSERGEISNRSLMGRWTIFLFGFLHCPDVCPTSLSQLAALARAMNGQPIGKKVDFVFVSVDPNRDSVTQVAQYARYFDAEILGATGNESQLTNLAKTLGIQFEVSPSDENYRVAHSVTFSIVDPSGHFRGRFRPGFDTSNLVSSLISSHYSL